MCTVRFFICKHCGNLVGMIHNSGVPIICCGEPMSELVANTVDASIEKHVPVVEQDGDTLTVRIGESPHPMTEAHYIQWVYVQTKGGGQRKCLSPGEEPKVTFALGGDEVVVVYAYCNLHGLWKA